MLRGGIPIFVGIREDTLNLDERLIEAAITPRTRAIVPLHYAGITREMDTIFGDHPTTQLARRRRRRARDYGLLQWASVGRSRLSRRLKFS